MQVQDSLNENLPQPPAAAALPGAAGWWRGLTARRYPWIDRLWFLASLVVVIGLLQWYVVSSQVSAVVFPPPAAVFQAFWADLSDGTYLAHVGITLYAIGMGFVFGGALGFGLALLISEQPIVRKVLYPYVIALQSVPKVALAPLFVVWFGFGLESKVALTTLSTFFPVLVTTLSGLDNTDPDLLDLMRAYSAQRRWVFLRVKLPSALPFLFAGLELAIILSVVATVVAEFIGAQKGLGYLVLLYNTRLDIGAEFGGLIALSLLGFGLHWLVKTAGNRLIFWRRKGETPSARPVNHAI
jgi:NitT/TauT family transport system permease protein